MSQVYAIVRLRGRVGVNYHAKKTLDLLRLRRVNHAVLYRSDPVIDGMLHKIKDIVTWGEVNQDTIEHLLKKRGQKAGRINISDKDVKENTDFSTIKKLSKALAKGDLKMKDVPTIKPVFRLSPPRKGFRSLKNPYNRRGDLGYRGEAINQLISRMA